jgi:hypothetical protein
MIALSCLLLKMDGSHKESKMLGVHCIGSCMGFSFPDCLSGSVRSFVVWKATLLQFN